MPVPWYPSVYSPHVDNIVPESQEHPMIKIMQTITLASVHVIVFCQC